MMMNLVDVTLIFKSLVLIEEYSYLLLDPSSTAVSKI